MHGFIFNEKNEVCILKFKDKDHWSPVGGGPEKGETFEQTFRRETREEADLEIKDIRRLGAIKIIPQHDPEDMHHQVRFVARVKKINKQTVDPAKGEIPKRKFIEPGEFNKYCQWQSNGQFQIGKALETL